MNTQDREREAQALVEKLDELLIQFQTQPEAGGTGFTRLFRRWISCDASRMDTGSRVLWSGVRDTVRELAEILEVLAGANHPLAERIAGDAVQRLTAPDTGCMSHEAAQFVQAVGLECGPLLPYLSQAALLRLQNQLLTKTPRKMMYPNERKLLNQTESLLVLPDPKVPLS